MALDEERRALLKLKKKHRNQVSGEIAQLKRQKDASQQLLNMQEVEQIKVLDQEVVHLQEQCTAIAERLPNLPHERACWRRRSRQRRSSAVEYAENFFI